MYIIKGEKGINMNVEKINLKVSQKNLIENKSQIIFEGRAQLENKDSYKINYQEIDQTRVELIISDKSGSLERSGEVNTLINFNLNKLEECKVTTTFGDLFMDVNTLEIKLENNYIFLYYELLEAGAVVGRFQLRLEWENE